MLSGSSPNRAAAWLPLPSRPAISPRRPGLPPGPPGTATASALQGPPFPAAQKPPRVPQAWGLLRLGRCPPNRPRQQDRARSQRRRTRAGRLAALTSGPGSTARSQGDLGSVRLKATQFPHRKPGGSTVPERPVRPASPAAPGDPRPPSSACSRSAALGSCRLRRPGGTRPTLTPGAEPWPRTGGLQIPAARISHGPVS